MIADELGRHAIELLDELGRDVLHQKIDGPIGQHRYHQINLLKSSRIESSPVKCNQCKWTEIEPTQIHSHRRPMGTRGRAHTRTHTHTWHIRMGYGREITLIKAETDVSFGERAFIRNPPATFMRTDLPARTLSSSLWVNSWRVPQGVAKPRLAVSAHRQKRKGERMQEVQSNRGKSSQDRLELVQQRLSAGWVGGATG